MKLLLPRAKSMMILVVIGLSGCSDQVILQSGLSEHDSTEIIAELTLRQLNVSKKIDKNGITLLVNRNDSNEAIHILSSNSFPRKKKVDFGDVFQKNGIISSPIEERARYIYAISQQLESTLEEIDGVILAKVSIVLSERVHPGEGIQPASASVFLKHNNLLIPDSIELRVRELVAASIPGLVNQSSNNVAVIFTLSTHYQPTRAASMQTKSPTLLSYWSGAIFFLLMLLSGAIWGWKYYIRRNILVEMIVEDSR